MRIPKILTQLVYSSFIFLVAFTFACKDDNKNEPDPVDNDPIVGTWELRAITPSTGVTVPGLEQVPTLFPCIYDLKLTFNANNTISTADCPAAVTVVNGFVPIGADSKWKVEGNNLKLTSGNTTEEFPFTRTDTDLVVTVDTNTDPAKPAANVLLIFKRV